MEFKLNPEGESIKKGAFEITIVDEDGKAVTVWSGLKLGPPRKLKFPENDELITRVKKALEWSRTMAHDDTWARAAVLWWIVDKP